MHRWLSYPSRALLVLSLSCFLSAYFVGFSLSATTPGQPNWSFDKQSLWEVNYPECGGKSQSPIKIVPSLAVPMNAGFLKLWAPVLPAPVTARLSADSTNFRLELANYQIQVSSTSILANNLLLEMHFHTPSEHIVDGKIYPLELHYVTVPLDYQQRIANGDNRYPVLVLAINVEPDENAPYWDLFDKLRTNIGQVTQATPVNVSLNPWIDMPSEFYVYRGSFTTPPCKEIVTFHIAKQPLKAKPAHIKAVTDAALRLMGPVGNARDVQATNGRTVESRTFYSTD